MDLKVGDIVEVIDLGQSSWDPDRDEIGAEYLKYFMAQHLSYWGGVPLKILAINVPYFLMQVIQTGNRFIMDSRFAQLRKASPDWVRNFIPCAKDKRSLFDEIMNPGKGD